MLITIGRVVGIPTEYEAHMRHEVERKRDAKDKVHDLVGEHLPIQLTVPEALVE